MTLHPASEEQQIIVDSIKESNIVVDAVAGSGKTTTNLHIALNYPGKNILLLTYNKDLKLDSRKRVSDLKIRNMEVHSFHSFCVKTYDSKAFDDNGIIQITEKDIEPKKLFSYDILLIDEIQDINSLYYELICKIAKDNGCDFKLAILGDIFQCINHWNHSDHRYIQKAEELFCFNDYDWKQCSLSTSYRLTNEISEFINYCLLGETRIQTLKSNKVVNYLICDTFKRNILLNHVLDYLEQGYLYEDIFILAPSIKSSQKMKPVQILANSLSQKEIPIYVPNSDDIELDKDELKGKIAFSTFHQAKGRERKVTIVFNFDESYFTFFGKNKNPFVCSNEIYVSVSRSIEQLSVIHHYENNFLPFLKKENLESYTNMFLINPLSVGFKCEKKNLDTAVTDLTRHLPSKVLKHCLGYFTMKKVQEPSSKINIPVKIKQGKLVESVSEISGIAIPSYFELMNTGTMSILRQPNLLIESKPKDYLFIEDNDNDNDNNNQIQDNTLCIINDCLQDIINISPTQLLYIANKWNAYKSGYQFKLNQINDYNWLTDKNLKLCIERLKKKISKDARYEVKYSIQENKELLNRKLNAYFDCIESDKLWELKCVKSLKNEHFLQLAIYMYIHKENCNKKKIQKQRFLDVGNNFDIMNFFINSDTCNNGLTDNTFNDYHYYIFNIITDEIYELTGDLESLKEMIEYLINYKYYSSLVISDKEFLENNLKIYNKYFVLE